MAWIGWPGRPAGQGLSRLITGPVGSLPALRAEVGDSFRYGAIWQRKRLLTARFQVRVLVPERKSRGLVAQWLERPPVERRAEGSIPFGTAGKVIPGGSKERAGNPAARHLPLHGCLAQRESATSTR